MNIAILSAVFNDWEALRHFLRAIDAEAVNLTRPIDVFIVDDGSTLSRPTYMAPVPFKNISVTIIQLACNLGNQRAVAVGLAYLSRLNAHDIIIVMDADGEDDPRYLPALIKVHIDNSDSIVVAQRGRRSEGVMFEVFYFFYKVLFRVLTGQQINFGNFSIIPKKHLSRLVRMPELWNHTAAAIVRSRVPIFRLMTIRGNRYAGQSSMNFISLIAHGLSAVAAFSDVLFVRTLVFSLLVAAGATALSGVAVILRALTNLAIPGWATTVVGISLVVVLQGLTLSIMAAFMTMTSRSSLLFVPAENGPAFILQVEAL